MKAAFISDKNGRNVGVFGRSKVMIIYDHNFRHTNMYFHMLNFVKNVKSFTKFFKNK